MFEISKKEIVERTGRLSAAEHYFAAPPSAEAAEAVGRPPLTMPRLLERHMPHLWFSLEWVVYRLSAWLHTAQSSPGEYIRLQLRGGSLPGEEVWKWEIIELTALLFWTRIAAAQAPQSARKALEEFDSRFDRFVASLSQC